MPIAMTCGCGNKVTVPDEFAGKKGRCRKCGAVMTIPPPSPNLPAVVEPKVAPIVVKIAEPIFMPVEVVDRPAPARSVYATVYGYEESPLCPFCAETIKANAKKCKHCGEIRDPILRATSRPSLAARPRRVRREPASSMLGTLIRLVCSLFRPPRKTSVSTEAAVDWSFLDDEKPVEAPVRSIPSVEPSNRCPHCDVAIDPPPKRSRKCPSCRSPMVPRRKRLMTPAEANEFDRALEIEREAWRDAEGYRRFQEGRLRAEHDIEQAKSSEVVSHFEMLLSGNECERCHRAPKRIPLKGCSPDKLPPFADCEYDDGWCRGGYVEVLKPKYGGPR